MPISLYISLFAVLMSLSQLQATIAEGIPTPTPSATPLNPVQQLRQAQRENFKGFEEDRRDYDNAIEMKDMEEHHDYLLHPHPLQEKPLPHKGI